MLNYCRIQARSVWNRLRYMDPLRSRLVLGGALFISLFTTLLFFAQFTLSMRDNTYDLLLRVKAKISPQLSSPAESPLVIIAIDNYTLASSSMAVPELFQHRYYTSIVKALDRAGAKAVALVRVLPRTIDENSNPEDAAQWLGAVSSIDMPVLSGLIWRSNQVVVPDIDYLTAAGISNFGFVNLARDGDARVRRVLIRNEACVNNLGCWSLAWLAARQLDPDLAPPGDEVWIDFDPRPQPAPVVSFLEVYRQSVQPSPDQAMSPEREQYFSRFKDKLVLIGEINYMNQGSWPTPFSQFTGYGDTTVEIMAQAISTLIDGREFHNLGGWGELFFILGLTAFSLIPLAVSQRCGPYPGLWMPAALVPLYLILCINAFTHHFYLPVLPGVTALILAQIFCQTIKAMESRQTIRNSLTALGLYVNPTLAEQVVFHPELLSRAGRRREMTVFFSDLVGFTALAEHMRPEELVVTLNRYFECMEPIITRYGGILDKFNGDSIMAFWGAPLMPRFDHAASGCLAALDQLEALARLNEELRAEGRHPFSTLMSLTTGPMVVGNIGTERHLNYTVMGDAVNLASRLVPVNKIYQTHIIVGERTAREAARSVELRTLDQVTVSGRRESLTIFEVMAHKGDLSEVARQGRDLFERALRLYFGRDFQKALGLFEETLAYLPGDGPAELMCQRCREFLLNPPGDDWLGVTSLNIK